MLKFFFLFLHKMSIQDTPTSTHNSMEKQEKYLYGFRGLGKEEYLIIILWLFSPFFYKNACYWEIKIIPYLSPNTPA